jgi:hypothetical protein
MFRFFTRKRDVREARHFERAHPPLAGVVGDAVPAAGVVDKPQGFDCAFGLSAFGVAVADVQSL